MILTSKILKKITKGEIIGDFTISGYAFNSKLVKVGDMFIALVGDTHDAHNFLAQAIANKAGALLINKSYYEKNKIDFPNLLIVADTGVALLEIAKYVREQCTGLMVGITGSIGKTTLKDMLSFLLHSCGSVVATQGNYNNHIGLPISLLNMEQGTQFGVFEMGMSAAGEIATLSNILCPHIGVITDISKAHSEFLHTLDNIASAKLEIINAMPATGILCINADNEYYAEHYKIAKKKLQQVYSFSTKDSSADMYLQNVKVLDATFPYTIQVTATIFQQEVTYILPSIAKHHGFLAMIALGITHLLKQDMPTLAKNFINFKIPQGRGNLSQEIVGNKQVMLINDSYNASPKSMLASLQAVLDLPQNKILVLGDMLELGDTEQQDHEQLQNIIKKIQPKAIILLGTRMLSLYNILPADMQKYHFISWHDAMLKLQSLADNNDIILVKGSKGSNTYKIVENITKTTN